MGLTRRDVLRETVRSLSRQYKVKIKLPLNSVDECMKAIDCIIFTANADKLNDNLFEKYLYTQSELLFLKTQIKELEKKKKWYHKIFFWK